MTQETDRVRRHTAAAVLRRIDEETNARLREQAEAPGSIARRLADLDDEWDIDRVVETEAAVTGLVGLALGAFVRREFFALPGIVGGAVLLYALSGRYPLLPAFRRMGVRTAREIARERYGLKALRGDFADMDSGTGSPDDGVIAQAPASARKPQELPDNNRTAASETQR
jgi:hypothetical protein